ncbi:MAG: SOS response-associated peptidase [Candidatus Parcubacteria bacterium]|nr:SOS response-associated peptidase [Candidatus Parcubacteria bacterium]
MCYHLSVNRKQKELEKRFGAEFSKPDLFMPIFYANGFEAPRIPVITNEEPEKIQMLTWGLIPHWIANEDKAKEIRFKTLNSRADTLFTKASFSEPIRKKRCLILADGFFDWREYKSKKYPYYIYLKSKEPFAFAGIWDEWINPDNKKKIKTVSIITTDANDLVAKIHNLKQRMPVILSKFEGRQWLGGLDDQEIKSMLDPYPAKEMAAYTVSKLITARGVDRNVPEVMEKFEYKKLEPI